MGRMESDWQTQVIDLGLQIVNKIKDNMPYQKFIADDPEILNGNLNLGVMTNCKNVRPLVVDMMG